MKNHVHNSTFSASRLSPCGIANSRVACGKRSRRYSISCFPAVTTRKNGFTLMELLVVIVIIGISFGLFLTINFSFSNPMDAIKKEAVKLQRILEFAQEQSVIRAEEYGLRFNEQRYRFMQLDSETEKWVDITTDKFLRNRVLPENMLIELDIEDVEVQLEEEDIDTGEPDWEIKPQVFIMSSGELTPDFVTRIRISGIDDYYELHGDVNGKFELKEIKDE